MMPDMFELIPLNEETKMAVRSLRSGMIYRGLQVEHDVYINPVRIPHSTHEHRLQVATEILTRNTYDDGKIMFASCKPDKESLPEFCIYLYHPDRGLILTTVYKQELGRWKIFHMRRRKPQGGRRKK